MLAISRLDLSDSANPHWAPGAHELPFVRGGGDMHNACFVRLDVEVFRLTS